MILIKTEEEVEKIRRACRVAAQTLRELGKTIQPGITTAELDQTGEELIRKAGAIPAFKGYRGYQHATCISVNEEVVHGIPGARRLKSGDVVGVDVGAVVEGYYGDIAASFPVGEVSEETYKLLRCGKEALELAIAQAEPRKHVGDLSHAIEQRARQDGYAVVRDLFGHGLGRSLHEDPLIPNFGIPGEGPELKAGMVIAIEPMINCGGSRIVTLEDGWTVITEDHSLSVHFEHSILITEGKPEVLTLL
jgi:methionyl aminopeptidase